MISKLLFDGYRGALDYFSENFRHDFRANERVSHDLNNRGSSSFLTFDGRLVTVSPVGNAKYDVYIFPVDDPDSLFYAEKLKDRLRNPSAFLYPMVW